MENTNYYELLGISVNSSNAEIEQAIRTTRKRYRQLVGSPDQKTRLNAEIVMSQLAEAEDTLLNDSLRQAYNHKIGALATKAQREIQIPPSRQEKPVPNNNGSSVEQWLESAEEYLASGSPESARVAVRKIFELDPDNSAAWLIEYRALIDLKQYEDAIVAIDQYLRIVPTDNDRRVVKLQLLYEIGAYDRADKFCRYIIERAPHLAGIDMPWWQMHLAHILFLKGNVDESFNYFKQLIAAYPNVSQIRVRYAEDLLSFVASSLSSNNTGLYIASQDQYDLLESSLTEVENLSVWDILTDETYLYLKKLFDEGSKKKYSGCFGCASVFFVMAFLGGVGSLFSNFTFSEFGSLLGTVFMAVIILGPIYLVTTKKRWELIAEENSKQH